MKTVKYIWLLGLLALWLAGEPLFAVAARSTIFVTYGQAGAMTPPTTLSGVSTYSFNNLPLGVDSSANWEEVGSFQTVNVASANSNGGASGSQYMADGLNGVTQTTLTLNTASSYLGLWLSAVNSSEVIDFYSKSGSLLAEFTTANLLKALPATYYGNPNSGTLHGTDPTQPFAYVNFLATSDIAWSSVVFKDSTGGGTFQADNIATRSKAYNPSSDGAMPGIQFEMITNGVETAIAIAPEPNPVLATLLIGGISAGGSILRRIRTASSKAVLA